MTLALPPPTPAGRSWWIVIEGSPPSKNDRRILQFGAKASVSKGERTKAWEDAAFPQIADQWHERPLTCEVRLSGVVYWKTRASDMDLSVIQDSLQGRIIRGKRGSGRRHVGLVIGDDSQVMEYGRWFRRFDSTRPRVELLIEEIGAEQGRLL